MSTFLGVDYLELETVLTEEERVIRDSVRDFVQTEVLPVIVACFRDERFPTEIIRKMGRMGLLGATFPKRYGCAGIGPLASGLIYRELERGDTGIRSFASVQSCFVMYAIEAFGTEEQKLRWLPRLAKGEAIGCFALSESDAGSNPAAMRTHATMKDNKSYVLDGSKKWVSFGSIADVAVVWAKVQKEERECVRAFLVEKGTPGINADEIKGKFSFRAAVVSDLVFDRCRIPAENILPRTEGLKSALMCINEGRYAIAWGAVGAAEACYHKALAYAKKRVGFSKPIAGHQLVQKKLVYMLTEITKAQLLCLQVARLKEARKLRPAQISMAKMNNASVALNIARLARDILGANGIVGDYHVIRHMLNLETANTYEGTEDINLLTTGKDITGLGAFD